MSVMLLHFLLVVLQCSGCYSILCRNLTTITWENDTYCERIDSSYISDIVFVQIFSMRIGPFDYNDVTQINEIHVPYCVHSGRGNISMSLYNGAIPNILDLQSHPTIARGQKVYVAANVSSLNTSNASNASIEAETDPSMCVVNSKYKSHQNKYIAKTNVYILNIILPQFRLF